MLVHQRVDNLDDGRSSPGHPTLLWLKHQIRPIRRQPAAFSRIFQVDSNLKSGTTMNKRPSTNRYYY